MFYDFKNIFFEQHCFSHHQIGLVFPKFDNKNLSRWQQKGYIIKLRNGLYTFPEHLDKPGFNLYVANRLYQPSYVSLHYALNFYGIIPEVINRVTSVSTLKSKQFTSQLGEFSFQSVQPAMFFGHEIKKNNFFDVQMATPEKAIIDLLYLYPFYKTAEDIEQLRFDKSILKNTINLKKLDAFLQKLNSSTINNKITLLKKVFLYD
jgi:predicted transcriptional regulator of viral defense system